VADVRIFDDGDADVSLSPPAGARDAGFIVHPALLDGAMQAIIGLIAARATLERGEAFLPSRFGRVRVFAPFGRLPLSARVRLDRVGGRSVLASIDLFDDRGAPIAEIGDCWFQRVQLSRPDALGDRVFRFDRLAAPRVEDDRSPDIAVGAILRDAAEGAGKNYGGTALLFDAFLAAAAYDAATAIVPPDHPFSIAGLIAAGTIDRGAAALLSDMLSTMERHLAASRDGNGWRLAATTDLPEADILWRTILREAPELTAELALAGRGDLKSILRRGLAGAEPPTALVEQMLYGSPSGILAADILTRTIRSMAARWPSERPLRILEIGAGSGFLTRRLAQGLADWRGTLAYTASDADGAPAIRFPRDASRSAFSTLRWDHENGGKLSKGPFDVIVSMYGLTRSSMSAAAFEQLHDALAPGGVLISAEPEPNAIWQSVFGQSESRGRNFRRGDGDPAGTADDLERAGFVTGEPLAIADLPWPIAFMTATRAREVASKPLAHSGDTAILIAAAEDALALATAAALRRAGVPTRIIDPPEVADGAELLKALNEAGAAPARILVLPPALASAGAGGATKRMAEALTVARLLSDADAPAELWLVTQGAQPRDEDGRPPAPAEAALWGLGRTLMNETPGLGCRMVDLPDAWSIEEAADALAKECAGPDAEREIVWSTHGRTVLKLRRGLPETGAWASSIALGVGQPGLLESLGWKDAGEPQPPAPGEIAIEVRAAGLNFRDVMWALALLPEEALMDGFSGPSLGLECTGIVRAIGDGVTGFAPGDRVMALAPAALRSHVNTPAHAVTALPDALTFAEGATIPVAYLTTIYALGTQARLEAGEWVLIHGGAGGVGLAAIAYAHHRGAIVIATAGSEVKREFLRKLGVDHVLDSRTVSFADDIRALTGGAGVDVVLNSLSGDAMERSLGLLKPFGRFVELGKRDFMFDTRVGLRALRQNVSYYAVDIDRLPVARPDLAAGLLRDVSDLMATGALYPLPYRAFSFADAPEAFRLMQASGHIGKIVLTADGHPVPRATDCTLAIRPDRTYLVTGGLSGFGLETARWLAARGARHLALLGRRGADTEGAARALEALGADGVDARAFACDVSQADSLDRTLSEIRTCLPPLAGIVHAAMVVDDGLAGALTASRIHAVLAPKLDGAINLDRLTRRDDIELFILYSSATTVLGAPGQGSYVAANMALEALARGRRAEGLPALAVAWGAISDAGYLAREEAARDALSRRLGAAPMTAREALDSLPALLASGEPVIACAPIRFDAASQYLPILGTPAFADVVTASAGPGGADLRERLAELPPDEAKAFIIGVLVEETGRILSLSPTAIDAKRPLSEFGMDSLMAVELRLALETRLGIDMPIVALSDNTSLTLIATRMMRTLSQQDNSAGRQNPNLPGRLEESLMRHEAAATAGTDTIRTPDLRLSSQEAAE
jgi:NADPH:quinone reductase-like Zn-dependent oxidoreductase/SAM-dependent methyltransferase/acyl carrier protein